jgi:N-acetylglucosamine-6-phosphate deacetylase
MLTAIRAERLFDGLVDQPLRQRTVIILDGSIDGVVEGDPALPSHAVLINTSLAAPGFIDMQINGAADRLFNDAPTTDTLAAIATGAQKGGAAYILPTFITAEGEAYRRAIDAADEARRRAVPGILGVHLEGPFLSPKRPGIHNSSAIRKIDDRDRDHLTSRKGGVRLITLAPEEQPSGVIANLVEAGWIVFAGHSEATASDMSRAADEGLRGVTHLFNAMRQITPREPGVVGSALADERLFAGIIADGHHVHPVNLRLAASALGPDRLCLVSDAMPTLGGALPGFSLADKQITLRDGRLTDADGTLAGAHLSMADAVANMVGIAGVSLAEALRQASTTPARALGLESELGQITPGMRAGLTLLDDQLHPRAVVVDGEVRSDDARRPEHR